MCFVGLIWGMAAGRSAALSEAALSAVMDAVQMALKLAGGFALWSGMLAIVERSGAIRAATRAFAPLLGRLFPHVKKGSPALEAMAMNMTANMLGLGNAATPIGLRAMRLLGEDAPKGGAATDAMCMFLVINASSLQLFPSTVVALRAAAGSASPASVVLPTLLATLVSTVVGIASCALLARLGKRHA
ncbi:MAG: spore maturation protein A [Oscillospiraceae bacterium]|jgi:spore maturation protein A|nr:spore maturation protein A [Oscillospiraceae bacterium]